MSLSHREHKEWKLHIANVQEVDRGWYMCQVNTDPMRSKRGYLEVQGEFTLLPSQFSASPTIMTMVQFLPRLLTAAVPMIWLCGRRREST